MGPLSLELYSLVILEGVFLSMDVMLDGVASSLCVYIYSKWDLADVLISTKSVTMVLSSKVIFDTLF